MSYQNCKPAAPEQEDFLRECEEIRMNIPGMTKSQMSIKSFGNASSYFYFINGKRNMTTTSMKKIADALGMKLVICLVEKGE